MPALALRWLKISDSQSGSLFGLWIEMWSDEHREEDSPEGGPRVGGWRELARLLEIRSATLLKADGLTRGDRIGSLPEIFVPYVID
ncbi:hypothetical protein [Oscillatoria sp. HE19RPO]|uniref:hypothetical protein n=1 Tax=Oscillatoria sp. HE19RPO TaxID=2954806 RepID=UPI0020C545E9|nr:hypothetical protein [Oscillatoria sp. HE19RPO]